MMSSYPLNRWSFKTLYSYVSIQLHKLLVNKFNTCKNRYMWRCSKFGWIKPIARILIISALRVRNYAREYFLWIAFLINVRLACYNMHLCSLSSIVWWHCHLRQETASWWTRFKGNSLSSEWFIISGTGNLDSKNFFKKYVYVTVQNDRKCILQFAW